MSAPVRTGRGKRSGKVTAPPQWHTGLLDAIAAAKRGYSPELAMQVVALMEYLPETQDAVASLYDHLGKQSVDMVELPPSTAEFFAALAKQQKQQGNALRTAMAACLTSVRDRIDRILAGRQKDAAWDVDRHKAGGW